MTSPSVSGPNNINGEAVDPIRLPLRLHVYRMRVLVESTMLMVVLVTTTLFLIQGLVITTLNATKYDRIGEKRSS